MTIPQTHESHILHSRRNFTHVYLRRITGCAIMLLQFRLQGCSLLTHTHTREITVIAVMSEESSQISPVNGRNKRELKSLQTLEVTMAFGISRGRHRADRHHQSGQLSLYRTAFPFTHMCCSVCVDRMRV